jgi:hypothetical protein
MPAPIGHDVGNLLVARPPVFERGGGPGGGAKGGGGGGAEGVEGNLRPVWNRGKGAIELVKPPATHKRVPLVRRSLLQVVVPHLHSLPELSTS